MPESLRSRLFRHGFNLLPAYRGTGARIRYISADWHEVRMELPFSWRTRNIVGSIFGGSLYGSVDPIFMIMLMQILGKGYVVWDKAAAIRFRKPGRTTLHGRFVLPHGEPDAIRALLETERSVDRIYPVDLVDAQGVVHAHIDKTIYVRRAAPPDGK